MFSCAWVFVTPQTVAHQAPLSMEFPRHEYWSGLPFPSPKDLPDPGIELESPVYPTLQADTLFLTECNFQLQIYGIYKYDTINFNKDVLDLCSSIWNGKY